MNYTLFKQTMGEEVEFERGREYTEDEWVAQFNYYKENIPTIINVVGSEGSEIDILKRWTHHFFEGYVIEIHGIQLKQ